ncbi:MAG: hypothetical protein WC385_03260 [Candidatus Paceibacterota bacterium]|jgi:hypothetical protein
MENKQYVGIIVLTLALWPALVFGYDNDFTHPLLTSEASKLFNQSSPQKLVETDIASIVRGSKDEDDIPRWLEHFYDPINNRGLNMGQFATSKQWAHGQNSTGNDYSWENAIYDYVYGDKQKGLYALGHVIHLVQDATVPDHTRDDIHIISKTYEAYAFNQKTVPASVPIYLNSLDTYFDNAANFSNNNFFSDDTILSYYQNPKILKILPEVGKDGVISNYGYNNYGRIVRVRNWWDDNAVPHTEYSLRDTDNKVMADYWNTLAPKAVGYSAGIIKLFFAEVEKEKETGALKKMRMPWWEKLLELVKIRVDQTLASVNLSLGDSATNYPPSPVAPEVIIPADAPPVEGQEESSPGPSPEEIRRQRLAELRRQLLQVRAELEALTGQGQQPIVSGIRSANLVLALAGAEMVSIEAPTTTATTTATTTPEASPLALNFSITNCAQSLSSDFCLLKPTSTLAFVWSPTEAGDYKYDLIKTAKDRWDGWLAPEAVITLTVETQASTSLVFAPNDLLKEFKWQIIARDASSSEVVATSSEISTIFHPRPVVINEIGWAGTIASNLDEWLELRNYLSDYPINLSGYYLSDINKTWQINLSGQISPEAYYLVERGSDNTISNRPANLVDNFIVDTGAKAFDLANLGLKLWHKIGASDELVDETPSRNKSGAGYGSLERTWEDRISTELSTWEDNPGCNEGDGPCALDRNATTTFGTPGVINQASIPRLW